MYSVFLTMGYSLKKFKFTVIISCESFQNEHPVNYFFLDYIIQALCIKVILH